MSVNSSSYTDPFSSNLTLDFPANACFRLKLSVFVFTAFSITSLFLLPIFIHTLYLGYRRWRRQGSVSATAASHADLFIYHSIIMQLITLFGSNCCYCGGYLNLQQLMMGGLYICVGVTVGQALLHTLTSVERYLAVVHPITYLSLKQGDKVRVRNASIGCVWLLSFVWLAACWAITYELYLIIHCLYMVLCSIVVSFCSISVLFALKHPVPGQVVGNKERGDQSKQRAFHTIAVILGVLTFRFTGNVVVNMIYRLKVVDPSNYCVALVSLSWVDLPSSLVLPLLFLQRMGKLPCCKHDSDEGR